ncbi:MAG: hypothetical protein JKY65_06335 [Planctomycetes bacterium]|nr:hypothetical protein [Planctomycetota bacterium]
MSLAPGTVHSGWKIVTRASSGPAPQFKVDKSGQAGILQAFPFKGAHGTSHQELAERLRTWQEVTHPELVPTEIEFKDRAVVVIRPNLDALPSVPHDAEKTCQVLQMAARALVEFHNRDLAHGELTPGSIRVDGGRRLLMPPALAPPSPAVSRLGLEADPRYAAPEVLDGRSPTPSSDMFSLGLILYSLLTGDSPTSTTEPADSLAARGALPAPPLKEGSAAMKALYAKLTAIRPEQRPKDAEELLADLAAILKKGKSPALNPLPKGEVQAVSIGGPLLLGVLLACLLGGLTYYMQTYLKSPSPVAEYVFPPVGKTSEAGAEKTQ